jgi:RHS repeat-associated protein
LRAPLSRAGGGHYGGRCGKEQAEADRQEAEEAGLYFTLDKGQGERYSFKSEELSRLRETLNLLGSVRSVSGDYGTLEERYEYDAFGKPHTGDLEHGMSLGYTGKPYDAATGLYNYGYRDYQPVTARFTTEDLIRDGSNWFAYVNNDPVNWRDPWGLSQSDAAAESVVVILNDQEINTLATGMPITPIENGLYTITSGYGPREPVVINGRIGSDFHTGIDMAAPEGTPVRSVMPGEVTETVQNDATYGNYIIIEHSEVFQTFYAHLNSIDVSQGNSVMGGQVVGTVGSTGFSTGSHLHFEYQDGNGESKNPHY